MSGSWVDQLQPGSWRGVPFVVDSAQGARGRRIAIHEYPYRDSVYVEDLGRGMRRYGLSVFVVGDDCFDQRNALLDACEVAGSGELIFPSLGTLNVVLGELATWTERKDLGRVVELQLAFIEVPATTLAYPDPLASTGDVVSGHADDFADAIASDFASVGGLLITGSIALADAISVAAGFVAFVLSAIGDAALLVHAVAGLVGSYGRYSNGNLAQSVSPTDTVASLVARATTARAAAAVDAGAFQAAAIVLDVTTTAAFVSAGLALMEAARLVAADPADQVRIAIEAHGYTTILPSATATATASACRRAAAASLARAAAAYQPTSYDDAIATMKRVCGILTAEITLAGNALDDASFIGLRSLRASVAADLMSRGASLAALRTWTLQGSLPALALANLLYGDGTRADELIARVNPPHPAFMPASFTALAD